MIISNSKKFIFIHLEKCGGTSIESALEPYLIKGLDKVIGSTGNGEKLQWSLFKRYGMNKVKSQMIWKHSDAAHIYNYVGKDNWKTYKKFSVVRNPVDLVESLYFFAEQSIDIHMRNQIDTKEWMHYLTTKKFPTTWPQCEPYVWAYIKSHLDESGFDGFVSHMIKEDYDCVRPQINRLRPTFFDSDIGYVVDISELNQKWVEIISMMGFHESIPLPRLNQSKRTEYVEMSPKIYKMLRLHFAKDYEVMPYFTGIYWE